MFDAICDQSDKLGFGNCNYLFPTEFIIVNINKVVGFTDAA